MASFAKANGEYVIQTTSGTKFSIPSDIVSFHQLQYIMNDGIVDSYGDPVEIHMEHNLKWIFSDLQNCKQRFKELSKRETTKEILAEVVQDYPDLEESLQNVCNFYRDLIMKIIMEQVKNQDNLKLKIIKEESGSQGTI